MIRRTCRLTKCASRLAHFLFACIVLGAPSSAEGAVPVEESIGNENTRVRPVQAQPARAPTPYGQAADEEPDSPGPLSQLFYQLQLLQQEVQMLRGSLEEQQYRLDRMAREQQERYIGLDKRISDLQGQAPAGQARTAVVDPALLGAGGTVGAGGTERDAYEAAYAMMQRQAFDQAADAFDMLIIDYPNGQYTPNAFYWLGELHRRNKELERARQSFVQVITLYPDHNKMPDSLYKLGVVYNELGDKSKALEYLERVMREYPSSTSSNLAKSYAAELR